MMRANSIEAAVREIRRVIVLLWKTWLIWVILIDVCMTPCPPISSNQPWSRVLKVIFPEINGRKIRGCAESRAKNHIEELK